MQSPESGGQRRMRRDGERQFRPAGARCDLRSGPDARVGQARVQLGILHRHPHEILPRTSVDVSYFRRSYGNFRVTDNRVLSPSDLDKFDVTAPSDPRLPGGGGDVVRGMYNLKPAKFGLASDNFVTLASNY